MFEKKIQILCFISCYIFIIGFLCSLNIVQVYATSNEEEKYNQNYQIWEFKEVEILGINQGLFERKVILGESKDSNIEDRIKLSINNKDNYIVGDKIFIKKNYLYDWRISSEKEYLEYQTSLENLVENNSEDIISEKVEQNPNIMVIKVKGKENRTIYIEDYSCTLNNKYYKISYSRFENNYLERFNSWVLKEDLIEITVNGEKVL